MNEQPLIHCELWRAGVLGTNLRPGMLTSLRKSTGERRGLLLPLTIFLFTLATRQADITWRPSPRFDGDDPGMAACETAHVPSTRLDHSAAMGRPSRATPGRQIPARAVIVELLSTGWANVGLGDAFIGADVGAAPPPGSANSWRTPERLTDELPVAINVTATNLLVAAR